jgi:ATP-dependent Clp protease ATP-binding subunit ClpC
MDSKFSKQMKDIMAYSKEEAIRLNNSHIGTEHIFLGILREGEGLAIEALVGLGLDLLEIKKAIETKIRLKGESVIKDIENIPLLKTAENALKVVYLEARALSDKTINTGHLLLAILRDETSLATMTLHEYEVTYENVKLMIQKEQPRGMADHNFNEDDDDDFGGRPEGPGNPQSSFLFLIILELTLPKQPKKTA